MSKTLVVGASENPERYSFKAVNALLKHQHEVLAIGGRDGQIGPVRITTGKPDFFDVDTVTMYIGPANQAGFYDYVIGLKPRRVIFNPGTENPEFEQLLTDAGIEPVEACTLVLLSTGQF